MNEHADEEGGRRTTTVRFLHNVTVRNALFQERTYHRGETCEMIEIDDSFWSSYDLDSAFVVTRAHVEVVAPLDDR